MRKWKIRAALRVLCLSFMWLLLGLLSVSLAVAAERPPYEFDATLSLTGGCGITKADPVPDPGCPTKKPPKAFTKPTAIAIDSHGDEYVASWGAEEGKQGRIDVFSPEGVYITEVPDGLGPKSIAVDSEGNLYTLDDRTGGVATFARYKPLKYEPGEEEIEYGPQEALATDSAPSEGGVAVDKNDHVLVDWPNVAIKEYSSAKEGNELLDTITNARLKFSTFIALDKQRRRLYASSCPDGDITKCWILVFNADKPSELLKEVKGPNPPEENFVSRKGWISIAVNEKTGDFFVGDLELGTNVYQFNEKYEHVSTLKLNNPELFNGGEALQIAVSNAKGAKNLEYLFVPSQNPNRALAFHPPEAFEPNIVSTSVRGIGEEEAELQALIEPDGAKTTYRFEYLSQKEWEEVGETFTGAKVAGEGTIQVAEQEAEVKAPVSGLSPGTEYRFLVTASNEKGPAEPKEATFTTYSDALVSNLCENQALRTSYSALLPDCRAYELVTPADTNGQAPSGANFAGDNYASAKTSPKGDVVTFLTHGGSIPGLGGAGGFNGDQYRTTRTEEGWSTELSGPEGTESSSPDPGSTSPEQLYSFWEATGEGSALIGGKETHYVRYPDGHSALVGRGSLGTDPRARGKLMTKGGTHIVFETNPATGPDQPIQLEPNAPPSGTVAVYDRTPDEVTHVVSLLPGDVTPAAGENAEYLGASPDGEGIAFKIGKKLYLRLGNATTYEIGEGVEFAGVSEGGARIFYVEGGDLIAFDVESEEEINFSEVGNAVPVNVSADGTRAYFASTTKIEGSGENPNGDVAQEGEENLYLSEEGTIHFVGAVTTRDVEDESTVSGLGFWISAIRGGIRAIDPSRTTPDGTVLLFSSRADLTGYAHEGAPELYRYDSVGNRLHCISCIPTRTPAAGGASLQSYLADPEAPPPLNLTSFIENLRPDGKRAVFQSEEALVSADNDGVQDVYEWEEEGVGSCTRKGGCVYLISSGHSAKDNYLYGVSESADDVFFTTSDVLVNGDNDTVSIYDARVNGGFAEVTKRPCEGEGCKPDLSPPPPAANSESGARPESGNVKPKTCPKGKHRAIRNGKEVCVKNKKHHHHKKKPGKAKKGAGK